MQTIGQTFQEAREQQGRTVLEAAAATRIKPTQISEMERDDFHSIVAPIYGRGFIKMYAEFLGLDPAPLLQQYNEKYGTAARPTLTPPEEPPPPERRRFGGHAAGPDRPSPISADAAAPRGERAPSAETAPARRVQVLKIPRKSVTQALLVTAAVTLLAVGLWAGVSALKARAAQRAAREANAAVAAPRPADDHTAIMEVPPAPYLDPGARPEPAPQANP